MPKNEDVVKKVSGHGRVYDSTSATINIPLYFKSHTKCKSLLKVTQEAYRQCKEKNRKSKTNIFTKNAQNLSGAPNDGFLLNALKTLFRLSAVPLDL